MTSDPLQVLPPTICCAPAMYKLKLNQLVHYGTASSNTVDTRLLPCLETVKPPFEMLKVLSP